MIDFASELKNYDGGTFSSEMRDGRPAPMRLCDICVYALQHREPGAKLGLGDLLKRDALTRRLYEAGEAEVSAEDVTILTRCIEAFSATVPVPTSVISHAVELLDPVGHKRMSGAA